MKKIYFVIFLMLLGTQNAFADRNDGAYAYLQGDYETAYNTMISLAKTSDDKIAQYYLGVMYMKGQGVEQDYEKAGEWFRKASEQGLAVARLAVDHRRSFRHPAVRAEPDRAFAE